MASRTPAPLRQGYHHGNLREALVAAARGLIAERGPAGFTLVEAARMAGVSAATPYRHFKDRDALVAELRRRGFEEFGRRMTAAAASDARPEEAFERMGRAYLAFAREEPGYYGAMFTPGPVKVAMAPGEADAGTFGALEASIGRIARAAAGARGEQRRLAFLVWALSHGIATLSAAGFPSGEAGVTPEDLLRGGVTDLIRGADVNGPASARKPATPGPDRGRPRPARSKRTTTS